MITLKDFQRLASSIQDFLVKLSEEEDHVNCAELRDCLCLSLLHMQRYFRLLKLKSKKSEQLLIKSLAQPLREVGETPNPGRFKWKWINLANPRVCASLNLGDKGISLLNGAISNGDFQEIKRLAEKSPASLQERDPLGRGCCTYAVHNKQNQALEYLLEKEGIDPNEEAHDGSTCLHRAVYDNNVDAVRIILSSGARPSPQDAWGRSPVHWSVLHTDCECLEILLDSNTDSHLQDNEGLSATMWACWFDHIEHLNVLIRADKENAEMEKDMRGRTMLHWAVRRSDKLDCLQTLLSDKNASCGDNEGKTPLHLAAEMGSVPACKLIIDIGGRDRLEDADQHGRTALHLATLCGQGEVVHFLVEQGAELDVRDKAGHRPIEYAQARRLHYCLLILAAQYRQRGVEINGMATFKFASAPKTPRHREFIPSTEMTKKGPWQPRPPPLETKSPPPDDEPTLNGPASEGEEPTLAVSDNEDSSEQLSQPSYERPAPVPLGSAPLGPVNRPPTRRGAKLERRQLQEPLHSAKQPVVVPPVARRAHSESPPRIQPQLVRLSEPSAGTKKRTISQPLRGPVKPGLFSPDGDDSHANSPPPRLSPVERPQPRPRRNLSPSPSPSPTRMTSSTGRMPIDLDSPPDTATQGTRSLRHK